MADKILDLNTSSIDGMKWSLVDNGDGKAQLQVTQDGRIIKAALDRNKSIAATGTKGYLDASKTMAHKAFIPNFVIEMWKNMYGVDVYDPGHREAVLKLLDDPDWADLRTGQGRLR